MSDLVKRLKGRTLRLLQKEYPHLEKRYWGRHVWGVGYGAWSTGNVTEEMVQEYLEQLTGDMALLVLPARRPRSYPRAVKIKMTRYPRKVRASAPLPS